MNQSKYYYLKYWSVGYEVSALNLEDPTGVDEFRESVVDEYRSWFDTLKCTLEVYESNMLGNQILVFWIIVKVDGGCYLEDGKLEEDWTKMQEAVCDSIETFLGKRKLTYIKL